MSKLNYNPDVLSCLANLSNDEVFTPPQLANQMLDLLPQELFRNPHVRFLDPCTKSGVFLREIAKRLLVGLADQMPDLQQRIDHIMHQQLFGLAITRLTAMMSRRSLYCSKDASGQYSISRFGSADGNIRYRDIRHQWVQGKCQYCGASQEVYDRGDSLESHAYEFIHTDNPNTLYNNMTFDVIIGNPPYQLGDGGNGASALPIYHMFIEQAKKLSPRFMVFIIPSRWLNGGRGLNEFRKEMLEEGKIHVLHDFFDSKECFTGVEIKGGICYFLWERDYIGICEVYSHRQGEVTHSSRQLLENGAEIFIRSDEQVSIFHKVLSKKELSLSSWLNAGRYFGFHTKIEWEKDNKGKIQSADGKQFYPVTKQKNKTNEVKIYVHGGVCWIKQDAIPKNRNRVFSYKVLIPRSGNPGFGNTITGKPIISEPGTCNSNTYMVAIPEYKDLTKIEADNLYEYIKTKFVRFLVATKTSTQSTPPDAFLFVPLQDFSKPWTDEELYKKYGLTDEEIQFIESMIRPME